MLNKKIVLTGGGTAGHVMVNLALIPALHKFGWQIDYIGSIDGIERQLITAQSGVRYFPIAAGKLRRYFDWENFKDPFKVMHGLVQAYRIIRKEKPAIVFSKGGFVSVPVVMAAWLNRVPAIIHESDLTPGLANKISVRFAHKVCITFPETRKFLPADKVVHVGPVIRPELRTGNASRGLNFCRFTRTKPVLLIMGGSLGSQRINQIVRKALPELLKHFQIVHLCGKGQVDESLRQRGYEQYEYLDKELPDVLAMTDIVVSRAGANSIFEFLALRKPMLLIPLSLNASRGDQILNARSFEKQGFAHKLEEEELTKDTFIEAVQRLYKHKDKMMEQMAESDTQGGLETLLALIKQTAADAEAKNV